MVLDLFLLELDNRVVIRKMALSLHFQEPLSEVLDRLWKSLDLLLIATSLSDVPVLGGSGVGPCKIAALRRLSDQGIRTAFGQTVEQSIVRRTFGSARISLTRWTSSRTGQVVCGIDQIKWFRFSVSRQAYFEM